MKKATVLSNNRIKELPEMSEPDDVELNDSNYHEWEEYNAAIAACRELEIVGTHNWKVGDVIEFGKHYTTETIDVKFVEKLVAIPIKQEQEDLYELVAAIVVKNYSKGLELTNGLEAFTITRK